MQDKKKGFHKYIYSIRKTRKNMIPLLNGAGELMTNDMGKDEVLNVSASVSKVTRLVDVGRAVDVVYLDFSKAFDTVSHSTFLEKLAARGLDRSTLCWVRNWLDGWAQRVLVNGAVSSWESVTNSVP
ncbi:hypothetical protein TURU_168905 [Turdus rufiventris]|nr:hypothetical protein TURU_168905 [Turdus rufiventris]